jgi:hypothetical protein
VALPGFVAGLVGVERVGVGLVRVGRAVAEHDHVAPAAQCVYEIGIGEHLRARQWGGEGEGESEKQPAA